MGTALLGQQPHVGGVKVTLADKCNIAITAWMWN